MKVPGPVRIAARVTGWVILACAGFTVWYWFAADYSYGAVAGTNSNGTPIDNASAVQAAINAGSVGEQADGYLGVKGSVGADVRAAVDAINIKRRAAYTDLAAKRGVTVQDVAASVGCTTLKNRVGDGQAYRLPDGVWRTKSGAISLPAYCA